MGGRRGDLPRVPPRPLSASADTAQCALDILSLDVWQNCAFTSLLGYREVCALACCSKALLALMTNELIWRELFLASKNTPALTTITNWREAFKQRTLMGTRWRMDSMVRSKVTWKWFVSRCMTSRVPYRISAHFQTLRVCRETYAEWQAARALARGGVVGMGGDADAMERVPILARPHNLLGGALGCDVAEGPEGAAACGAGGTEDRRRSAMSGTLTASFGSARPPALPGSASSIDEQPPTAAIAAITLTSTTELADTSPTPLTATAEDEGNAQQQQQELVAEQADCASALCAACIASATAAPLSFEPCAACERSGKSACFDRAGRRVFARIGDAIAAASPLDRIVIEPGEYHENLVVDKPLELVGAESSKPVIIRGDCSAATVWLTASCRLSHLTLTQTPATAESPILATVLASGGLHVCIDDCDISSSAGHSVVVKGQRTKATLRHNRVHSSRGVGVLFCDDASGLLSDSVVYANKRAGVAVLRGGAPLISENLIRDGEDSGVLVSEAGRGRIEGNLIRGNTRAGVAVLQAGQPHVLHNTIICGKDSGVLVCEGGEGVIEHNLIDANRIAGVAICSGAAPHLLDNRIGKGDGRSLCVADGCHPLIEHNALEATAEPSSLALPSSIRASIGLRNKLSEGPVIEPAELAVLIAASAPAVGGAQLGMGIRRGTDSSALDDTLSPLGIARATRRTASLLNTIVLKRTRVRSI